MHSSLPSPTVALINPDNVPRVVLICEHASNYIPPEYNNLGLDDAALNSHIAWDPGALAVAQYMAKTLAAPLLVQNISRLVYDCNRPPDEPTAMRDSSEIYEIPGNLNLTVEQKQTRVEKYYQTFNQAVSLIVDGQIAQGNPPIIVTIHSFTPTYNGQQRAVEIGILHDDDARFADRMLNTIADDTRFNTQRNQPYGPEDGVTHTIVLHGQSKGLLNVMIEIRSDLIDTKNDQQEMATYLAQIIKKCVANQKINGAKNG
ncbi:MAG: N-formylglutamate amidohydrolase [Rhizobiales bacterium]|nr:N-formylglutamate amidohydrolase [Hyphomicrobiales bacterium]NRB15380.1 N-formylglutamate amidohydrolase [Hyphomicrobiales bacterium]